MEQELVIGIGAGDELDQELVVITRDGGADDPVGTIDGDAVAGCEVFGISRAGHSLTVKALAVSRQGIRSRSCLGSQRPDLRGQRLR